MKNAGRINKNMKFSEGVARRLNQIGRLKAVGDIRLQRNCRAAEVIDSPAGPLSPLNIDIADGNRRAAGGKSQRDRLSVIGAAACDQGVATAWINLVSWHKKFTDV